MTKKLRVLNPGIRIIGILLCTLTVTFAFCHAQIIQSGTVERIVSDPPFSGTIFLDPDIITPSDPTTFQSLTVVGQAFRTMFDRRANAFVMLNAYLFNASYDDGLSIEIQVNPEFGSVNAARTEAEAYAPVIGQLPTALRKDVQTVWIHKGVNPFGGGNNNLLIHVGQADLYVQDGILEETLVHEASHTSLDADHAAATGWVAAQTADAEFISTYARDFPTREDVAESFLTWLAIRYRADRISKDLNDTISNTIPNRIAYFDAATLDMHPIQSPSVRIERVGQEIPEQNRLDQSYPNPFRGETQIPFELAGPAFLYLNVFDMVGRKVKSLAGGSFPAGRFEVTWDASGMPSGLYVVSLETETFSVSKKLLLLK